jgi:hypothetical protein
MNTKQIVLSVVAVEFLALTAYAVAVHGYIGIFAEWFSSWAGLLGVADLAIALGLVTVWMLIDARKHGLKVLPFLLITATLGSAGPLLYLVRREWAIRGR